MPDTVSDDLEGLFSAVREACTARTWSLGIELARADAVDGLEVTTQEVSLRVKSAGRTVAPRVTLSIDDEEWSCDCDSTADACEHVAAAVIALRQARKAGKLMPSAATAGGCVGYRLCAEGSRMAIARVVKSRAGEVTELRGSLAALLSSRAVGPAVEPTRADLAIDRFLEDKRVRALEADTFVLLMPLLAQVDDVLLATPPALPDASVPVVVSTEPLKPKAILEPAGGGYRLRITASPLLGRVVIPGVALTMPEGDQPRAMLMPLGAVDLTGPRLERLPREVRYARDDVAQLVSEIVPDLRLRLDLEIAAELPRIGQATKPELRLEVSQVGPALSVLPLMVYGDPPCARIDDGRLVHLGGPIPRRDERAEARLAASLRESLDLVLGRRASLVGPAAVTMAQRLRRRRDVHGSAHVEHYPEDPLAAEVSWADGTFDVVFRAAGGDRTADAREATLAFERGESVVSLSGGGWARLPLEWMARHGARVASLLEARDAEGKLARHAHAALIELCDALERPRPLDLGRLAPLVDGFDRLPTAELPSDLRAELRSYQKTGVDWLCFLRDAELGALLADDMGLGKTLEAMCAVRGRSLVVCPTSVVHNWLDELDRFRPGVDVSVYHGARRALDPGATLTLTSYAVLRNDIELLAAERWDVVVLDESQAIKNPDSQVARAAYRLSARFRVTLSGTPVENRLDELWSQMHFANPGLLGGRSDFKARYEVPIAAGDPSAAQHLRARIRPFVMRRLKRDVAAELPPRTEAIMHCVLDTEEREVYEAVALATRTDVLATLDAGGSVLEALEALLRLRQASCDAALVPGQGRLASEADGRPRASSKVRRLMSALEELAAAGHKALVFSQWTSLLDRVEPQLEQVAIPFVRLDGSTRDRAGVVATFQSRDGPPVMLLSLKAGGTGLNLTAADHVFLLDPWWNPAAEDQAADRAHRIGQDKPVMVYRLVADDTVEERILTLQEHKRSLADAALGEAERAGGLTRDDLRALLGG